MAVPALAQSIGGGVLLGDEGYRGEELFDWLYEEADSLRVMPSEPVLILDRSARTSTDVPKIGTWSRAEVDLPPESGPDLQAIAAACRLVA